MTHHDNLEGCLFGATLFIFGLAFIALCVYLSNRQVQKAAEIERLDNESKAAQAPGLMELFPAKFKVIDHDAEPFMPDNNNLTHYVKMARYHFNQAHDAKRRENTLEAYQEIFTAEHYANLAETLVASIISIAASDTLLD